MAEDVVRAMLRSALKELVDVEDMRADLMRRKQRRDYAFKKDPEEVVAVNAGWAEYKRRKAAADRNARVVIMKTAPDPYSKQVVRFCEFTGDAEHPWDEAGHKRACPHISVMNNCLKHGHKHLLVLEDGWRRCLPECQTPVQVKEL